MRGLDHDLVNGPLNRLKLALEFTVLGGGDTCGDDRSRDVASAPQGSLGFDKDIRDILLYRSDRERWITSGVSETYLLFAEQGKMQENFERLCIGGENDEFGDTTVQGFRSWRSVVSVCPGAGGTRREARTLVSTLFELLVLGGLVDELQNLIP